MTDANETTRATVRFHGHVQGVGFRWTTNGVARRLPVEGYVRNEPDGTVLMAAEGDRESVLLLIRSIKEAMTGHITRTDVDWAAATGEFDGFVIRR